MKRKLMTALCAMLALCLLGGCAAPAAKAPDISSSAWLDAYLEETLPAYGKDFTQSAAFSYREEGGGKLVHLYASKTGVEEVRSYYLANHAGRESGRNDSTALRLTMTLERGEAVLCNYYSPVSQVYEIETALTDEAATPLAEAVKAAFPAAAAEALAETKLLEGEPDGGYVRYTYDDLDPYYRQGTPIFSRAYSWNGTTGDFDADVALLRENHGKYSYDKAQDVHYFGTEAGVLTVALLPQAGEERRVVIGFQALKMAE